MAFILAEIIEEIHEKFREISKLQAIPVELGNLEKALHGDTPRIVWTLIGGTFRPSTEIGGVAGAQDQALANFAVWLWFDDLEQTWDAMENLRAAIRATAYGPNVDSLNFQCPTEVNGRHIEKGEAFILQIALSVPQRLVGTQEVPEVTLEHHEANVEVRVALDGVVMEPVIVTGPE